MTDLREFLENIVKECNDRRACSGCSFFDVKENECMFFDVPGTWDIPEILERGDLS